MRAPRRLRVLHLGRFHHEIPGGGIERHVASLLSGLAREVEVANLVAANGPRGDVVLADGYHVYRAPCYGKLASTALAPALISLARRLHREHRYDIVHMHFPDPLSHLAVYALPRSVRRVVTWHSDIVRHRRLFSLYRPWLDRFLADVDAVITATPVNFAAFRQLASVPPTRRHVIPFGLDYALFDSAASEERARAVRSAIGNDGLSLVLAVGRHVYYKGFDVLLEAIAQLPSCHLVLVGEGPLTPSLRSRADALGITARVTFAGRVDDVELAAWYRACDVFCLPSVEPAETFGLVQIEAMACGKPVVSTQLGTGVEYVNVDGETGIVVPPRDVAALAAALHRLLSDSALAQRMGAAARRRAREEFSFQAMVARTLALYRSLQRA